MRKGFTVKMTTQTKYRNWGFISSRKWGAIRFPEKQKQGMAWEIMYENSTNSTLVAHLYPKLTHLYAHNVKVDISPEYLPQILLYA